MVWWRQRRDRPLAHAQDSAMPLVHAHPYRPSSLTVAATFDPELAFAWGSGMGKEFFMKGANVQLGPGLNVARVPVNGRNFECVPAARGWLARSPFTHTSC
jgi:hypothetical protein